MIPIMNHLKLKYYIYI